VLFQPQDCLQVSANPDFVPIDYKVPIAVTEWLAGIVGFNTEEALGGQASPLQNSP
jgi:hypothetical protein